MTEPQTLLRIIEDTLLAAARVSGDYLPPSDEFDDLDVTLVHLAARLFCVLGFDRDTIGSYVWVPSIVEEHFRQAVADHYDGAVT